VSGRKYKTTSASYGPKQWQAGQERAKKEERKTENQAGQEHGQDCIP
jgi:hypothetical protein